MCVHVVDDIYYFQTTSMYYQNTTCILPPVINEKIKPLFIWSWVESIIVTSIPHASVVFVLKKRKEIKTLQDIRNKSKLLLRVQNVDEKFITKIMLCTVAIGDEVGYFRGDTTFYLCGTSDSQT